MKVYCVMENNEEDTYVSLIKVFSSKAKAEEYLELARKHAIGLMFVDEYEVE